LKLARAAAGRPIRETELRKPFYGLHWKREDFVYSLAS